MEARWLWALFLVAGAATGLPEWSWDTIQTYVHCANLTGEWNPAALAVLASQRFVVFEKNHKLFEPPVGREAESKIAASCARVKALNASVQCFMYTESDWARDWYELGQWVDSTPDAGLQCPPGRFVRTTDIEFDSADKKTRRAYNFSFKAYDFTNPAVRDRWVARVTDAVKTGHVDGAFIDGNRGGWNSGITGPCSQSKRQAWAAGLEQAVRALATELGPNRTLISNYPTPEALELCSGGMMERGGSSESIQQFGKRLCGLSNSSCLLDYHAQYFSSPDDGKMASFLLGAQKYAYWGGGSGWGGTGPGACSLWLEQFSEFSRPLGPPLRDMQVSTASWPGAVCQPGSRGNQTGCLFSRGFGSGTKVFVGQFLAPDRMPRPTNQGACIYWSDGHTTSRNPAHCPPKEQLLV